MAPYLLNEASYICLDRRHCVFLDVRSDKYIAVARQVMDRLSPWLVGWPLHPSERAPDFIPKDLAEFADDLLRRGVLTTSIDRGKPVCPQNIPPPRESLFPSLEPPSLSSTLRCCGPTVASLLWARNRLSNHSLASNIDAVIARRTARRHSARQPDMSRARSIVGVFTGLRVFYSRPNSCLFESLSLLHLLARSKLFPSLVFGVIPEPFQAHCWLQYGSVVLNDTVSHAAHYTPIMLI